jgi:hydrogenase maturation protease
MTEKILFLGYGNPDRGDDGVAWHVLKGIVEGLDLTAPLTPEDPFPEFDQRIHFLFMLQLVPEVSEIIANYDKVCFIDAHTGEIKVPVRAIRINPKFQHSPFTHHLTPQTCLELTNSIYHQRPIGYLVSIKGFSFQFEEKLTHSTNEYAQTAINLLLKWVRTGEFQEIGTP